MKKLFSFLVIFILFLFILISCNKELGNDSPKQIDSINLTDTVFLTDTIWNYDTIFIHNTIIHTDTIVMIDTVIMIDTSEFAYLFKHYELGKYELLFYTINKQKDPSRICRMYSDGPEIDYLVEGYKFYPIWSEDANKIIYLDYSLASIVEKNINTNEITEICPIDRNVMFLRYFKAEDKFLVSYNDGNKSKIGAIDYKNNSFIELTSIGADERCPNASDVDDWIYFSRLSNKNGTYDIFRRKLDSSIEESVYVDPEFNLATFSVSADGKFLITPKYSNGKGYIVFYDVERHHIIHEMILPVDGHPLYATLSKDNRAIFFVNGTPYNYSEPRNIYRMGLDRTQLYKMTNFTEHLASRPLVK
jgi:hypothetical protein